MPAPANDNFANAIPLGNAQSGVVNGSNVGATAEAGEPANFGKTVWWVWSTPPNADQIDYVFSTRFQGGQPAGQQWTNFATELAIFTGISVNALTEVARVQMYAGQLQGQIVLRNPGTYYIRVDGVNGATGHIRLWWDLFFELQLGDCQGCPDTSAAGETLVGCMTVDITRRNFVNIPAGRGLYIARYCRGVWNYHYGWVIGQIPPSADQTWPDNDHPGWFMHFHYTNNGEQVAVLNETPSVLFGWADERQAIAALPPCPQVTFQHDGVGSIRMHFTDEVYNDNFLSDYFPPPSFAVYKVKPVLKALGNAVQFVRAFGANNYNISCFVQNLTNFTWANVTVTLSGPNIQTPVQVVVTLAAQATTNVIFSGVVIAPLGTLDVVVTLNFNDGANIWPTLVFDLSPVIQVVATSQGHYTCSGVAMEYVFLQANFISGIPPLDLWVSPTFSGATNPTDNNCVPTTSFDFGTSDSSPGSVVKFIGYRPMPGASVVTLNLALADHGIDGLQNVPLPPAQISVGV